MRSHSINNVQPDSSRSFDVVRSIICAQFMLLLTAPSWVVWLIYRITYCAAQMILYLILLRVIPGVKVHLVRNWPVMVKLVGSWLMDRFVGVMGLGGRWSCWRWSCRTRRRSRIITDCWTRCIRFLMCWVGRSVECCSCWSLGPRRSGWAIIILWVEVKQPTNTVTGLCLGIMILNTLCTHWRSC